MLLRNTGDSVRVHVHSEQPPLWQCCNEPKRVLPVPVLLFFMCQLFDNRVRTQFEAFMC